METRIYAPGPAVFQEAAERLRRGEVVGLPTETVYGLAGHALDPLAAAAIFRAKERPLFDPLIVHLPDAVWLERLTTWESPAQEALARRLLARYWPGPLTLILPRRPDAVPDLVTAGSAHVAVRMSAHPVFRAAIAAFGGPLAAPSANRFGRISPTSAADVLEELGGRIEMIIDGGGTEHGLESTIVRPDAAGRLALLRHGPITAEDLSECAPILPSARRGSDNLGLTPGALPGHYAPHTPLHLLDEPAESFQRRHPGRKLGLLAFRAPVPEVGSGTWRAVECLSPSGDLREAAIHLFAALRRLDHARLDLILAEPVPAMGLGVAIMERLGRAVAGSGEESS